MISQKTPSKQQTHPHLNVVKRRHHPRSKLEWNFDKAAATSTHTDFYTRANVKMPSCLGDGGGASCAKKISGFNLMI